MRTPDQFSQDLEDAYNDAGRFFDTFDPDDWDQEVEGFEGEYWDGCGNCIARIVGGRVAPLIEEHVSDLQEEIERLRAMLI